MSITATFYTFSKRKNSTKRPSGGTSFNILIKEPSSVLSPSIELQTSNPRAYNYCYIPSYDRYYFVSDWVSDHNRWTANLTVDVLASWRDSIRASRQYVLRSASSYNSYISDPLYPGTLKKDFESHEFALDEKCFNSQNFTYVIGVMNGIANTPRLGGITYYVLTANQIQNLMNALLGDADYLGKSSGGSWVFPDLFGITKEVMQALVNPTQYIVDSYMLPYSIPYTATSKFKIGWWTLPGFTDDVQVVLTQNQVYKNSFYTCDYLLPAHPQNTRGAYMNGNPYTQRTLNAGCFGEIQLDCNDLVYANTHITMNVAGDYLGNCELIITGKQNGALITRRNACVKIPFKIGQMFQDRIGMAQNVIDQVTTGVSAGMSPFSGDIAKTTGSFGGYGSAVLDSFSTSMPKVSIFGSTGALFDVIKTWRIDSYFTYCVDDDQSQRGKPLCEDVYLNTLSGFCLVADPDIEFTCYDTEYTEIASYMSSGFFLE